MGGRKAAKGFASLSHHYIYAYSNYYSLPFQEQISRLAKETSNNPVEASSSTLPTAEQKPPPSIGRQPIDDPSRRYTIVKQDESENERPRLPTSPYATHVSSFNVDSPPNVVRLYKS